MTIGSDQSNGVLQSAQGSADGMEPDARRLGRLPRLALMIAGVVLFALFWQASVSLLHVPPYILPSLPKVWGALWSGIATSPFDPAGFYLPLANTLKNAGLGYLVGVALGIALGSLMAEFEPIETILMPYTFAMQALPKVAIAPLVVIWCGFGDGSKVAMAALMTFFPMMVNTFTGIHSAEPERLDLMRSISASRFETYRVVKLPSAASYIFAGLNMGVVYALLGTIIAEFLGAQQGIGVSIVQSQAVSDTAGLFAALVLLGLVGIILHWVVGAAERRIVHWTERRNG
jgi:NitT/TauT family transport system permease protein